MSSAVLVTGAAGQDGAYLCRDLLADGAQVFAALRPGTEADADALWRLRELGLLGQKRLQLVAADLRDATACAELVARAQPQQVFHLAAASSVARAFAAPLDSLADNGLSTVNLLEALRRHAPQARAVVASSGEVLMPRAGRVDEDSALQAPHPYALSKLLAHAAVATYRASYGLQVGAAVLFNHESPLRGSGFVTRKIAIAAAAWAAGRGAPLALGNLDAERDFGYAPDYVAGMRAQLERAPARDFVFASGELATIRRFATLAYAAAGVALEWRGSGVTEHALDRADGRRCIVVDAALLRPVDATRLQADASRARRELGFAPSLDLARLAALLVEAERARLARPAA